MKTFCGTLGQIVLDAIARFPEREALYDGRTRWTYRELGESTARAVSLFRDRGLKRGDGVALLSSNRVELWALVCAANLMGLRYTPLHPLGEEEDHAYVINDAQVSVLIIEAGRFGPLGVALRARTPGLRHLLSLGDVPGAANVLPLLLRAPCAALIDDGESEEVSWLIYTGGTTGRSKGVMLSHRSMSTMTMIMMADWEWPRRPRYALVTPMSHAAGIALYAVMALGGYTRILQSFELEVFCTTVERESLNTTFLVPTLIYRLIDAERTRARCNLTSLELIIYGAAPMSPERLRRGIEIFGSVFLQLYGQSECPLVITTMRQVDHDLSKPGRLGSCGRPSPLMQVRLLDREHREVPTGAPGEICVRGPLVMSGYWRQPGLTAEALAGNWLHTGDVAVRDADGYFYIVDRMKDLIISGGFNIYPREVEDALMSHGAVASAAVVGIPDEKWGEAVKAFVVLAQDQTATAQELQAHVKGKRGGPWVPKSVDFVPDIPLTPFGKADRKALRAPYWANQTRGVS